MHVLSYSHPRSHHLFGHRGRGSLLPEELKSCPQTGKKYDSIPASTKTHRCLKSMDLCSDARTTGGERGIVSPTPRPPGSRQAFERGDPVATTLANLFWHVGEIPLKVPPKKEQTDPFPFTCELAPACGNVCQALELCGPVEAAREPHVKFYIS